MITEMKPQPKTFHMKGGGTISGSTPEEIVVALRADSWKPEASVEEFMEAMSRRCRFYSGAVITTWNAEEFVNDLVNHRFLVDADDPPDVILPFKPPFEE